MKPEYSLFNRQKVLIALLHELGGNISNLDFQKLLFLYCCESEAKPSYEFVPYRFGAFSFTSYADRRKLIERGLLVDESDIWELTDVGRKRGAGLEKQAKDIIEFVQSNRNLRGDSLIAETYRRYPYYGIQSQIAEKVLHGEDAALRKIEAARPERGAPGIATIGYEGHSLEAYLNILLEDGVTLLCDVRRNALSRKYGFSKRTLSNACEGVDIRYEHLPKLGISSDQRKDLSTQESYDHLFASYQRDVLPEQSASLECIAEWVEKGERVALTCYEHLPGQCHRHCVSETMQQRLGSTYTTRHL